MQTWKQHVTLHDLTSSTRRYVTLDSMIVDCVTLQHMMTWRYTHEKKHIHHRHTKNNRHILHIPYIPHMCAYKNSITHTNTDRQTCKQTLHTVKPLRCISLRFKTCKYMSSHCLAFHCVTLHVIATCYQIYYYSITSIYNAQTTLH